MSDTLAWKKREDHGEDFEDGETLLVAVQLYNGETRHAVVSVDCDEGHFRIKCNRQPWQFDWDDVDFYIPIKSLPPLPMRK